MASVKMPRALPLPSRPLAMPINGAYTHLAPPSTKTTKSALPIRSAHAGHAYTAYAHVAEPYVSELLQETMQLNNNRQVRGMREYEILKKRYSKP